MTSLPQPAVVLVTGIQAAGAWAIAQLDEVLRSHTPRLGLWLDTSAQTAAQTVEEILARAWPEAAVTDG